MVEADKGDSLLITGAIVLTFDEKREIIDDGAIAIKGDRIVAVGLSKDLRRRFPEMETLDATGKAVMPGFINSHTDAVLMVLRGTVEDMSGDAIFGYMTPISFAMTDTQRRALAASVAWRPSVPVRRQWWNLFASSLAMPRVWSRPACDYG